jgi:DNA mismatch repair protein MutL
MSIHILSDHVIAQIAAGEVVERPTSVVKELIENALDAEASAIHVGIKGGGRALIRVSDDGVGIRSDEALLAFTRHATSKLQTADDLERITTLGFRGEALASIASVSQVAMTTRHRTENIGTQIRVEGGAVRHHAPAGAPAGTLLAVENLFYNMPARLKFLKKDTTEKRTIANLITRYAMAYPGVKFVLEQDDREIFRSSGSGQLPDAVVKALGLDTFRQMVEVISEDLAREDRPAVRVYGYASVPDFSRTDRSGITLFVNGRWIHDSSLSYAVVQAYHTLLMNGRYPVAVLMVELPPHEVDVNVHPTKAEVRFRDPNAVFASVQRAVREAVVAGAGTPEMRGGRIAPMRPSFAQREAYSGAGSRSPIAPRQLDLDLPLESAGRYQPQRASEAGAVDDDLAGIPVGMGAPVRPRTLPMLRVVGQVSAMYIIAEGPAGMYLIDQHAAHERILYEQFMDAHERQETIAQQALTGQTILLGPVEAALVDEQAEALRRIGFDLEPFGVNTFMIRAVPALLADSEPVEVVSGILDDLLQDRQPGSGTIEEKLIRQVCRRAAVKAGQILSHEQMQSLIRQLERSRSPLTCPHGRPTMLHMSADRLAREFGRSS